MEQKLQKNMLSLACRRHIMEIMLSAVVDQPLAPSADPNIQLFNMFKNSWDTIGQSDYKTIIHDFEAKISSKVVSDRISFAENQLKVY